MDSEQQKAPLHLEELLAQIESDPSLREEVPPTKPPSDTPTNPSGSADTSPLSALFSSGDLIGKLPQLLQVLQALREPPPPPPAPNPSPISLLNALRPYLNDRRRQALDTMIRLSKLNDSLHALH